MYIMSVSMHIQNLVKFYQFVLMIFSGNENLISIMGQNLRKISDNNPHLDLVNINAYTKCGKIQFVLKILSGNKIMTDGMTDDPNRI